MRNIWYAIPSYTGTVSIATMRSILTDCIDLIKRGDKVTIFDESANAIIADARAHIISKFLSSDADTLLFIDNDVAWNKGASIRLIDAEEDFVAGVYPMRKQEEEYRILWDETKKELWENENGFLEVDAVPFGFVKLSRDAIEKIVSWYQGLEYYSENSPDKKAWALFDPVWEDNKKFGEDFSFCKRWKRNGGKIYIDPNMTMAHVGDSVFIGNVAEWLKGEI